MIYWTNNNNGNPVNKGQKKLRYNIILQYLKCEGRNVFGFS